LFFASVIIAASITSHFTRLYVSKLRIFVLKILDATIDNLGNPSVLTPKGRQLITTLRTFPHYAFGSKNRL